MGEVPSSVKSLAIIIQIPKALEMITHTAAIIATNHTANY